MYCINTWFCLLFLIGARINDVSCQTLREKYNYDEATNVWFKLHEIPANFTDAFLRCKAEGAMLASPTTEAFTESMKSIISKKTSACAIYTGIHAMFSKGDFSSAEGIPLSAIPVSWATGAPDNYENSEDCLVMLPSGQLDDVKCNDTYPYLCYKEKHDIENTDCETDDKAYTLELRTGRCYKFHNIGQNWVRAYMTCHAEGGYLAIPNSIIEVNVLKELFAKYPESAIFADLKYVVSLGFHDQFQENSWFTIKGQTLQEAGYSQFNDAQPDNSNKYDGGSNCGAMFRNGRYDDMWCFSVTLPFICEKNVARFPNN